MDNLSAPNTGGIAAAEAKAVKTDINLLQDRLHKVCENLTETLGLVTGAANRLFGPSAVNAIKDQINYNGEEGLHDIVNMLTTLNRLEKLANSLRQEVNRF